MLASRKALISTSYSGAASRPFQTLLDQAVEDGEQVGYALGCDVELRTPCGSVPPVVGHHGEARSVQQRLHRHLDGEVELAGDERLHTLDHLAPVALEAVAEVVVALAQQQGDEAIAQTIEHALHGRVVLDVGARNEAGAEGAVEALPDPLPVGQHVRWRIRCVGHGDHHCVSAKVAQAGAHGISVAVGSGVAHVPKPGEALLQLLQRRLGGVAAGVVDDEDLVLAAGALELGSDLRNRRSDGVGLVVGGDHDRKHGTALGGRCVAGWPHG